MDETERVIQTWLHSIGATDIGYVGADGGHPDFEITYRGRQIAVEAEWLTKTPKWIGLWNKLDAIVAEANQEADRLERRTKYE